MRGIRTQIRLRLGQLSYLAAGLCFAGTLAAESNLISKSPFLPPGWRPPQPPTVQPPPQAAPPILARQLEFKGMIDFGDEQKFSLYDKKSGDSYWMPLNEMREGFQVIRYDPGRASIYIRSGGRTEELQMATVDETPMQISGGAAASVTASSTPSRPAPPSVTPSSSGTGNGPMIPRRRIVSENNGGQPQTPSNGGPNNPLPKPPGS